MDLTGVLKDIAAKSVPVLHDGDFVKDGLLHCGKCKKPRETIIRLNTGEELKVGCMCPCDEEKERIEKERKEEEERFIHVKALRTSGIHDKALMDKRFDPDDHSKATEMAKKYVSNWKTVKQENIGMLFWGTPGTGKTHTAACIVNALIDMGIPCMMTSFPRILSDLTTPVEFIDDMNSYDLVVIDDLGAERQTDYSQEIVFRVIDERYKSKLPIIITTNLSMDVLKKPSDITHQRIYERVLEMCVPKRFDGDNRRAAAREEKFKKAKELFG